MLRDTAFHKLGVDLYKHLHEKADTTSSEIQSGDLACFEPCSLVYWPSLEVANVADYKGGLLQITAKSQVDCRITSFCTKSKVRSFKLVNIAKRTCTFQYISSTNCKPSPSS